MDSEMKNFITIAWDIDDVLNELEHEWFIHGWKAEHPLCKLEYEDLKKNPPHEIIGATKEEYLASLDRFRFSSYSKLKPIPEMLNWFKEHGHKCRHIALTSTPLATAPLSAEWLVKHFGTWIRTFHFIPSSRAGVVIPKYDSGKGEYLKYSEKVQYLVEDSEENITGAEKVGVKGILYPRPWNNGKGDANDMLAKLTEIVDRKK